MVHQSSRSWLPPSLTGRSPHIHIHQYMGYRLHLLWDPTNDERDRSMCIEGVFLMYDEISDFCETLMSKLFEGMCDCECINVSEWLKDKVESFQLAITTHSQKPIIYCPRSWLRTLQKTERYKAFRCTCRDTSSYAVFLV